MIAGSGVAARECLAGQCSDDLPWPLPVLQTFPTWAAYRRKPSQLRTRAVIKFSAEQLEQLYRGAEAAAAAGDGFHSSSLYGEPQRCFQGVPAAVGVVIHGSITAERKAFSLGIAVRLLGLPAGAVLPCTYTILSATKRPRKQVDISAVTQRFGTEYVGGWATCDADGWDGFKAWLVEEH